MSVPSSSNNSGLTKDALAPSGEIVYKSESTLRKYNDPANSNTSTIAKVITKVNIKSGDIELYESENEDLHEMEC